jgi:hypothetical protein
MTHQFAGFGPTTMTFNTGLTVLFIGGAGYFSVLALAWLTA